MEFPEREKLKIMFLRETEGVYKFGTKRIHIKIEKGDNIFCRVGGGYMHIDNFIDQYTQGEVDKIERKDVMGKFTRKLAVQSISANVAQDARESSPIKSP